MKTLKSLLLIVFFVGAVQLTQASNYYAKEYEVEPDNGIGTCIARFIKEDFSRPENYFYKNGINKFKEEVVIKFVIDSENKFKLLRTEGDSDVAVAYVKQLFRDNKIEINDACINKVYRLKLVLDYRTSF